MNDSERRPFKDEMIALGIAFRVDITDARLEVFWQDLEAFTIEAVVHACRTHRREGEKFPVPLDLRMLAKAYERDQRVLAAKKADEIEAKQFRARAKLLEAARSQRPTRDPIPAEARTMLTQLFGNDAMRSIPPLPANEEVH